MKKLRALRAATQVLNQADDIEHQVAALYDELLQKNQLLEEDIVSIIFSVSDDIDAKNPAAALRQSGRAANTALFTTQEPPIPPQHPRIIRALIHCYMDEQTAREHIYRNGAQILRPDWVKP